MLNVVVTVTVCHQFAIVATWSNREERGERREERRREQRRWISCF
jgi:hypothetical protein